MRMFIVEDDINVIKVLEKIINDRKLGDLIGYATDGIEGLKEIQVLKPDIVLVDLLMPGKDGISLVHDAKTSYPELKFIMLSQVASKDMIAKAYEKGVEYYINKPINAIEVESVIRKVMQQLDMSHTLNQIRKYFSNDVATVKVDDKAVIQRNMDMDYEQQLKDAMQKIGIMGQIGSNDIVKIIKFLLIEKKTMADYSIKQLCSHFTDHPKSMEQRIRRTAQMGMVNLANLGIEDYMNEIFVEHSNGLYNFEQIKKEMDFIRGKSKKGGKVNLKKFLDGMVFYCEK